jgi:hypothetical protein
MIAVRNISTKVQDGVLYKLKQWGLLHSSSQEMSWLLRCMIPHSSNYALTATVADKRAKTVVH